MLFCDQSVHVLHGKSTITLLFGEHSLQMTLREAESIAGQMIDRTRGEKCCGTCVLWSSRGTNSVMGRCTLATPPWVSRDSDSTHKSDGESCEYHSF
jgi:hypothetical protein